MSDQYADLVVSFHVEPGGVAHAAARKSGTPRSGLLTLCGLPVAGMTEREPYPPGYEKTPGVAAEPFYSRRGHAACRERLVV